MSNFYAMLTDVGLAKLNNAQRTTEKVQLTHMAFGDGDGIAYSPSGHETALKREVWRTTISNAPTVSSNLVSVEGVIPAAQGGWTIREVGIYDSEGDLIAIANYPDTPKPVLASNGTTMDLVIIIEVEVNNSSNVNVLIDPNVVSASRKFVEQTIEPITQQLAQTESQISTLESMKVSKADRTYVDGLLNGISNASPRDVYYSVSALQTAFPNGEIGTYLVFDSSFTDGAHAFIWSDSESLWKDLGVYQANTIADNSVNPKNLTENINTFVFENILPYTQFVVGTISSTSGINVANDMRIRSNFMKVSKDSYISFIVDGLVEYGVVIYDLSKSFISSTNFMDNSYYEIPNDCYVRITMRRKNNAIITVNEISSLENLIALYAKKELDIKSTEAFKTEFMKHGKNLFNKATAIEGMYVKANDGVIAASAPYYASDWIDVIPGQTVTLTEDYQKALYDKFGNYVEGRVSGTGKTFTIPNKVYKLRTSVHKDMIDKFQVEIGDVETSYETYRGLYLKQSAINNNKLNGLKWGVIGDSISTPNYRALGFEYPAKIAMDNGMIQNNLAVPGSMITKSSISGHTDTHMSERILSLDSDCDIITIAGGVNDLRNSRALGVMGDTGLTTFYGALDNLCRNVYSKFPDKPKAIFTPLKYRGRNTDLLPYVNAIKEVANKYAIPVLDLYNICTLQPDIDTINDTYFYNSDGLHPNKGGHNIIARLVQNFLLSIV